MLASSVSRGMLAEKPTPSDRPSPTPMQAPPWERIGLARRYRFEREFGRGGMATVFLAHDIAHDRPVAIKVMRPELATATTSDRFLREIRVTARLQHQPPDAKMGRPLDVSRVTEIAFAPQSSESGHFAIGRIVVVK